MCYAGFFARGIGKDCFMDKHDSKKLCRLLLAFYILLFLVMLVLNFMTPLLSDDFSYSFSFDEDIRMEHLSQIIPSMQAHRSILNGRVIAHSMVQFFLILPKAVFNIVNTLNILLLAFLFSRFFEGDKKRTALLLACGAFFIWNYSPAFGQNFLWLDGAVNYSWGISVFLLFILPYALLYLRGGRDMKPVLKVLFVILGFIAGAYSENGSISAIFAVVCLSVLILIRDKKLPLHLILAFSASILGFLFLMSAPATSGRSAEMNFSYLARNIIKIACSAKEVLLPLYIVFAVTFVLALPSPEKKNRLIISGILFLSGLGSLAAFIFANYFTDRHFCFTIVFTVLACLINLDILAENGKPYIARMLNAATAVLFIFNFALGFIDIASTFGKALQREAEIAAALNAGEKSVKLEIYQPSTPYSAAYGLDDVQPLPEPDTWPNCSVAMYYGFDSVLGYYPEE